MNEYELARRAKQLPEKFADRVGDELPILRSHAAGGEWGDLVDDLLATLVHFGAAVSTAERDELATLAEATGEGSQYLDKLTVNA